MGASDLEELTQYSDRFEGRKGLLTLTKKTDVTNASCTSPIEYTPAGLEDLGMEIARVVKAASNKGIATERVFFSSPSPGTLGVFFDNEYYGCHADYVAALGRAMKHEYEAIVAAGLTLQA